MTKTMTYATGCKCQSCKEDEAACNEDWKYIWGDKVDQFTQKSFSDTDGRKRFNIPIKARHVLQILCKTLGCYAIAWHYDFWDIFEEKKKLYPAKENVFTKTVEELATALALPTPEDPLASIDQGLDLTGGEGYVLFHTEEEMKKAFESISSDDYPHQNTDIRIYVTSFSPTGFVNEST